MPETYEGWHFLRDDRRPRWRIGRHGLKPIEVGTTYRVRGPLVICEHGLHASADPLDALQYAPGAIVTRVTLSGDVLLGNGHNADKACATERTVHALADVTRELHEFAIWCARRALMRERRTGQEPDERSWNALRVKQRWLDGKTSDAELAAAWHAARAAAGAAAGDAERKAQSRRLTLVLNQALEKVGRDA